MSYFFNFKSIGKFKPKSHIFFFNFKPNGKFKPKDHIFFNFKPNDKFSKFNMTKFPKN